MPGKVKVRVLAGRNLPVMDKSSDTSDAFVEVKLGNITYKTDVYRKSLNPHWKSEWFKFEADDEELQDEPLQIRVMDYDTYSANDAIGKVYIDLNPLLLCRDASSVMAGWIPIFDTMHGIRGEVNVIVKVELFSDLNRFRESSCGVQFFCVSGCPHGYRIHAVHGFVEELVVNDDPEYQWIDKIRTPRASNEARQTLFSKLSGEVQRKTGLKALELGGNAVIGYQQCFDLEGESGIVVRAIGTAVTLARNILDVQSSHPVSSPFKDLSRESPVPEDIFLLPGSPTGCPVPSVRLSQSPAKCSVLLRTSDTDLSLTTKVVGGLAGGAPLPQNHRPRRQADLDMLEYPFLSMTRFPPGFVVHLGGVVSARSVKLLGRTNDSLDEPETRDSWWTELRMEIRAHARSLGCNVVLGYTESTSISEDVCLLSATGTAAIVNFHALDRTPAELRETVSEREKVTVVEKPIDIAIVDSVTSKSRQLSEGSEDSSGSASLPTTNCHMCHIPYSEASVPFPVSLFKCAICRLSRVPDLLFATIEIPRGIPITGKGCLVQARVCRPKKDAKGEMNAKEISDSLPFLEYELHKQLLNKLKVKGMNALFGLRLQVSVGAKILIAVATCTGVFLSPLPAPNIPKISSVKSVDDQRLIEVKRWLQETVVKNCDIYGIKQEPIKDKVIPEMVEEVTENDDDLPELDLSFGNKDACVLEIDDSEDVDIIALLIDPRVPDGFDVCNTECVPGIDNLACNLQMFTRVWRSRTPASGLSTRQFSQMCENTMQGLFFKLRKMVPCALCNLQFFIDIPDDEELQLIILGTAVGIGEPRSVKKTILITKNVNLPASTSENVDNEQELTVNIDELRSVGTDAGQSASTQHEASGAHKHRRKTDKMSKSFKHAYHLTGKAHHGIDLSSLSYIPGSKIESYIGNLNFFFIRESTALRESGGLSGFMQSFVAEVLAIVRAHVAALGGNALVSFFMNQCILLHNPHKNQGQCLINVGGDAVQVLCRMILKEEHETAINVSLRKNVSPTRNVACTESTCSATPAMTSNNTST